jgi:hypothetical protein
MTAMADLSGRPLEKLQGRGMYEHYRPLFNGTLIANVGITPQAGNALIADGLVDLAAFGQPFIANPDLPARLAGGVALATRMLPRSTRVGRSATSTIRNIARPATRKVPFHGHAPIQQRPRISLSGADLRRSLPRPSHLANKHG